MWPYLSVCPWERENSGVSPSSYKDTNPIMGFTLLTSFKPKYFPKAPLSNIITLRFRTLSYEFRGGYTQSISSVQSLSHVRLFATPWIAACQASLSITNSQSLLKLISIESVMPSSPLILCHPLLLLPPIPPSIRVFSNESTLRIRGAKVLEFQLQHQSFQWIPRTDLLCWRRLSP